MEYERPDKEVNKRTGKLLAVSIVYGCLATLFVYLPITYLEAFINIPTPLKMVIASTMIAIWALYHPIIEKGE